jgi:hypothetical protein
VNNFHQTTGISTVLLLLKALWRWLLSSLNGEQEYRGLTRLPRQHVRTPCSQKLSSQSYQVPVSVKARPLRVVRVLETGQKKTQVGRMVISGRMADVCAELERMDACELVR